MPYICRQPFSSLHARYRLSPGLRNFNNTTKINTPLSTIPSDTPKAFQIKGILLRDDVPDLAKALNEHFVDAGL
jgi:hypothetical protein